MSAEIVNHGMSADNYRELSSWHVSGNHGMSADIENLGMSLGIMARLQILRTLACPWELWHVTGNYGMSAEINNHDMSADVGNYGMSADTENCGMSAVIEN